MSRTTIKDYEEITEVLKRYVDGMAAGKSEMMKPSFHKNATMYGYVQGVGLIEGSIENLYSITDKGGPDPNRQARIDILSVVETAAAARIVIENARGATYTDFHHLLKIDGEWKIISKIFHQH